MPTYQMWREKVTHYCYEVEANSIEEAEELFDNDDLEPVDEQETWNTTDIEEVKE